ncbi:unnamed protein product, partial [Scytosiphon promiscuus]
RAREQPLEVLRVRFISFTPISDLYLDLILDYFLGWCGMRISSRSLLFPRLLRGTGVRGRETQRVRGACVRTRVFAFFLLRVAKSSRVSFAEHGPRVLKNKTLPYDRRTRSNTQTGHFPRRVSCGTTDVGVHTSSSSRSGNLG